MEEPEVTEEPEAPEKPGALQKTDMPQEPDVLENPGSGTTGAMEKTTTRCVGLTAMIVAQLKTAANTALEMHAYALGSPMQTI